MFLQVSVFPQVGWHVMDRGCLPRGYCTPPDPEADTPEMIIETGGTHPTGMHSCLGMWFMTNSKIRSCLCVCSAYDLRADLHAVWCSCIQGGLVGHFTQVCYGTGSLLQRSSTGKKHFTIRTKKLSLRFENKHGKYFNWVIDSLLF